MPKASAKGGGRVRRVGGNDITLPRHFADLIVWVML